VLYRIAQKQLEKIRVFSADCELDFGGLPLIWLSDVKPAESLRWLGSVATDATVENREGRRRADGAIMAIAHHQAPEADRLLETLAAASRPLELRKQAAFWMGTVRGRTGYEALRRLVREDTNEKLREHITFALSQSQEPDAILTLIQTAREDASTRVRGQALFWLAQKAGRRAAEAIAAAIDQDPETQVKKKAVFALHQLPKDEGIPLLIQVARNNKNPVVRKEAMFWLGQSNDSRALEFFEEVLSK
jgi:HEAT repeat protein